MDGSRGNLPPLLTSQWTLELRLPPEINSYNSCVPVLFSRKLQRLISSNEEKMANLKNSALMLQQQCNKPCEDEVKIQTITGEGAKKKKINLVTVSPSPFHKKFPNPHSRQNICPCSVFTYRLKSIWGMRVNKVNRHRIVFWPCLKGISQQP